jgi:hypothetical protein
MNNEKNSNKTLWIIIVAVVVAVITTLTILAIRLRWVDKLRLHCKRRKNKPTFTCEFDGDEMLTDMDGADLLTAEE